jgi:hypothetical protein
MKDNSIDIEVVPVEIVRCPRCGSRNRLVKQERHAGYRCGGCGTPLENPFASYSILKRCFQGIARRNSSRLLGKFIGALVIALVIFAILQNHDQQPAHSLEPGLVVPPKVLTIDSQASRPAAPSPEPLFSRSRQVSPPSLETPAVPPRSLENGTILADVINAGHSQFTVDNGTDRDAVIKLIDQTKGETVVTIYVTAHSSATANLIPEGIFTALCGQGVDWDDKSYAFTRERSFEKFEPDLDFTMKLKQSGGQTVREYKHVKLGLAPSVLGEMREADISEKTFLEY